MESIIPTGNAISDINPITSKRGKVKRHSGALCTFTGGLHLAYVM